jgi:hypothetical protein
MLRVVINALLDVSTTRESAGLNAFNKPFTRIVETTNPERELLKIIPERALIGKCRRRTEGAKGQRVGRWHHYCPDAQRNSGAPES